MTYAFTSDIGETSCSEFPRRLRGLHPMALDERGRAFDDHGLAIPEGVPYPDHHWNWLPVCTEFNARTAGR